MAKTIKLPGIGKVRQEWAYAGGALVAGIVGYAWLTRSRQAAAPEDALLGPVEGEDLEGAGLGFLGEGGTGGQSGEREKGFGFDTNAEWSQFALDYLGRFGVDQAAASLALGKFLRREALDNAERDMVRRAIGVAGEPPQDRPWQIIAAPPPPATQPPPTQPPPATQRPAKPVVRVTYKGTGPDVVISWGRVPGATHYYIQRDGGPEGTQPRVNLGNVTVHRAKTQVRAPGHYYGWHVWAANAKGLSAPAPTGGILVRP